MVYVVKTIYGRQMYDFLPFNTNVFDKGILSFPNDFNILHRGINCKTIINKTLSNHDTFFVYE